MDGLKYVIYDVFFPYGFSSNYHENNLLNLEVVYFSLLYVYVSPIIYLFFYKRT